MLKDKCVFVGIGQGGGNIVNYLEKDHVKCFYVNTSLDDLESIEADMSKRYAIDGTQGMAKDIILADKVINTDNNDEKIADAVYKQYPNAKIYFFVFTASGGTGGGMGNQIARAFKECYEDKIVNIITVLPHEQEDMKMQYNASKCIERIKDNINQGYVNNVQILDNNKFEFGKKLEINVKFALYMSDVLNFESSFSENGNLDEEEMERLFSAVSGVLDINEIGNNDFLTNLDAVESNSIYVTHTKDVHTHGLILNEQKNDITSMELIRETFGMPIETHSTTWQDDFSIIISVGMALGDSIILKLKQNYSKLKKIREDIAKRASSQQEDLEVVDVDFSDMEVTPVQSPIKTSTGETIRSRRRNKDKHLGVRAENAFRRSSR